MAANVVRRTGKKWTSEVPDFKTSALLLKSYGKSKALADGKKLHAELAARGMDRNRFIGNTLMQMYGCCGSINDARKVFDSIRDANLFSWNIIIGAYVQNGNLQEARSLFDSMTRKDVVTWNTIIAAYAQNGKLEEARSLFDEMGDRDAVSWNTMIAAYVQYRELEEARVLFEKMPDSQKNIKTYTTMITLYAQHGHLQDARNLFDKMVDPDVVCWTNLMKAYVQAGDLTEARKLFDRMQIKDGVAWNSMIAAYTQRGYLEEAKLLFNEMPLKDQVTWNVMIAAYGQNGQLQEARKIFDQMKIRDTISWNAIIAAYAQNGCVENAKIMFDMTPDPDVLSWNTMIAAYGQYGNVQQAKCLFDEMPRRNTVSWNGLLQAYAQSFSEKKMAVRYFRIMDLEGMHPDKITFVITLHSCANPAALADGKTIHAIVEQQSEAMGDVVIRNAVLNMYGKCGELNLARDVFDKMLQRDTLSWNGMIAAYAHHGHRMQAHRLFAEMLQNGQEPDAITFVTIIFACSHGGTLRIARIYFQMMVADFGIKAMVEQYACMVDLLVRVGRLCDAEELMNSMPFEPDAFAWRSFASACEIRGDRNRASRAAAAAQALLSDVQNSDLAKRSESNRRMKLMSEDDDKVLNVDDSDAIASSKTIKASLKKMKSNEGVLQDRRKDVSRERFVGESEYGDEEELPSPMSVHSSSLQEKRKKIEKRNSRSELCLRNMSEQLKEEDEEFVIPKLEGSDEEEEDEECWVWEGSKKSNSNFSKNNMKRIKKRKKIR